MRQITIDVLDGGYVLSYQSTFRKEPQQLIVTTERKLFVELKKMLPADESITITGQGEGK